MGENSRSTASDYLEACSRSRTPALKAHAAMLEEKLRTEADDKVGAGLLEDPHSVVHLHKRIHIFDIVIYHTLLTANCRGMFLLMLQQLTND